MTIDIDAIALQVERETDDFLVDKIAAPEEWSRIYRNEYAHRLIAAVDAERDAQDPVAWLHGSRTKSDVITADVKKLLIDENSRHGFDSLIQRHPVSKAENYTIPLYLAQNHAQSDHSATQSENSENA